MTTTPNYDPTSHLPAYRRLTRETDIALKDFWASVGFRDLTSAEIEGIVGAPFSPGNILREFGTGEYPPPDLYSSGSQR